MPMDDFHPEIKIVLLENKEKEINYDIREQC